MKLRTMEKMKKLPGPRYRHQGKGFGESGEEFRDEHLIPAFDRAISLCEILEVDMDGAKFGYPTSFLEEAFGGLARNRGVELVLENIKITCSSEPMLIEEVLHYVRHGEDEKTPPFEVD